MAQKQNLSLCQKFKRSDVYIDAKKLEQVE